MMLYFLMIISALFIATLLLHLRIRFQWKDENHSVLFIGLGYSGLQYDFDHKSLWLVFRGRSVIKKKTSITVKPVTKAKTAKLEKTRKKKKIDWRRSIEITPAILYYTGEYFLELLKSLQWEEVKAKIEAGFDEPDLTGITFGYYQAALAAAPTIMNKIDYQPVWQEQTFHGSARLSVSLPLYQLVWKTIIWIIKLPIRKIIKLAIGYNRGVRDDK